MDFSKVKNYIQNNKKILVILAIGGLVTYGIFWGGDSATKTERQKQTSVGPSQSQISSEEKLKAEIESLRKIIADLDAKIQKSKDELPAIKTPTKKESSDDTKVKELQEVLKGIKKEPVQKTESEDVKRETGSPTPPPAPIPQIKVPRIVKIDIPQSPEQMPIQTTTNFSQTAANVSSAVISEQSDNDIYLPAGSFASFTLISGAYAPESGEMMPVSAVIDKVFVGPNKSAIPLKGCFFLGKARGLIADGKADIKPVKLSCVWQNGQTFETEIAGYVTDIDGRYGLTGKVNRHTGEFFATQGLAAFLGGFASGMARAQESETAAVAGETVAKTVNIVGSATQYGALKAVSELANAAKSFFEARSRELVQSIDVPLGARGYMYVTNGIKIKGGKVNSVWSQPYYYSNNLSSYIK